MVRPQLTVDTGKNSQYFKQNKNADEINDQHTQDNEKSKLVLNPMNPYQSQENPDLANNR